MKYTLLSLLLFCVVFSALGQEHDPTRQRCVYYVDKNPGKGAGQLDDAWCKACMKIAAEKQKEEDRKNAAERMAREARIKQAAADRQAAIKAEAAKLEQRNATALAQLNDINRQNEDFDRIRRAEASRKQAINADYNNRVEKANRDYNEQLAQLQQAASRDIPATNDPFWRETVFATNYEAFQDNKSGKWGFADKQGTVKIPAIYYYAKNFSGGITYVEVRDRENQSLLINSKGESIVSFDQELARRLSHESGMDIRSFSRPDTISNGMMVMSFSVIEDGKYISRYGAFDKEGRLVIKPLFHKIAPFKNGTAQASLFLDKEDTEFKTIDRYYMASYTYLETGLIDKKGKWVQPPKQKMEYQYSSSGIGYLTVTDKSWDRLTQAEKDAANARVELMKKNRHAEALEKQESEVRQKVSSAQGRGYLIEEIK